jgi:hypothetical protein
MIQGVMLDFATNFLEVRPLLKRAGCLKEAVRVRFMSFSNLNRDSIPTWSLHQ